jgi:hypothetical protein
MDAKFKDVEAVFSRMKRRFHGGEISQREFIDGLKQLRIKDEEGRFWMIGPQSGKWYYFEGKDWVQSSPPSIGEKKAICIYCGYENDLESAVCVGCGGRVGEGKEEEKPGICPECGSEIDPETDACPYCAAREMELAKDSDEPVGPAAPREDSGVTCIVRSVQPLSFLWFSGALGTVAGVFLGLLAGATDFFPGLTETLPAFFKDMQGKLVGGVVFAGLGGGLGFLASSLAGFLLALAANGILSFIGGLKVRIEPPGGKG